ncbi:type I glutamate--ammonia ligase [Clostridium folliculivorans]|uniref:Glutamine synthetase n=1 Tax=Clostridium folliculivorans TaxID=2886038 RepID=A0A9W6DCS4_9CLOT|nr:type I glutamate--ammonia ligase [Clostridium folliculivorans]GKU27301.1 glutamine synthetase [Clostridium folliculivorans]GKU32152.1 glutamine synthetase [Clostridium folliculivorans]
MSYSKEDIVRLVEENDVRFIRLQFTDIFGTMKNVAITSRQLNKALNNECFFDGSSIEGFVRMEEADMYLAPDLDTFQLMPWSTPDGNIARLICDVYTGEGKPFEGDPRYILKKVINEAKDLGYTFNVGPECEFFLFHTNDDGSPTTNTHDNAGYFDLGHIDLGEEARRDMCIALEQMGFEIEASHHEVARGQHEIDFKYDNALKTADNIMTFKSVVKTIAQSHGLHATFMPKPIFGISGSGMHVNMSLSKDGINAFFDEKDDLGISEDAYSFIAGLLNHIKGIVVVTNPLVNSYKRLVPDYEAPIYISWSPKNRSPLVRIPISRGKSTRVELRCPDPSCNPYLALALCLAAGLEGIKKKLTPPKNIEANIFDMTEEQRKEQGIDRLPDNLYDAIVEFSKDGLVKDTLGDHAFQVYKEAKNLEWDDYRAKVHQWEIDQYLSKF